MPRPGIWTVEEHDRFLAAITEHPDGPWMAIAEAVGTRSVRQVQTHTQKYYEKIMRRMRSARKERKAWARIEHRIEDDILDFCSIMNGSRSARSSSVVATATTATLPIKATGARSARLLGSANSGKMDLATGPNIIDGSLVSGDYAFTQAELAELADLDIGSLDFNDLDGDSDGDTLSQLPTLEDSLDFFIASLERDLEPAP